MINLIFFKYFDHLLELGIHYFLSEPILDSHQRVFQKLPVLDQIYFGSQLPAVSEALVLNESNFTNLSCKISLPAKSSGVTVSVLSCWVIVCRLPSRLAYLFYHLVKKTLLLYQYGNRSCDFLPDPLSCNLAVNYCQNCLFQNRYDLDQWYLS